jgi:hypothetical protein
LKAKLSANHMCLIKAEPIIADSAPTTIDFHFNNISFSSIKKSNAWF